MYLETQFSALKLSTALLYNVVS